MWSQRTKTGNLNPVVFLFTLKSPFQSKILGSWMVRWESSLCHVQTKTPSRKLCLIFQVKLFHLKSFGPWLADGQSCSPTHLPLEATSQVRGTLSTHAGSHIGSLSIDEPRHSGSFPYFHFLQQNHHHHHVSFRLVKVFVFVTFINSHQGVQKTTQAKKSKMHYLNLNLNDEYDNQYFWEQLENER